MKQRRHYFLFIILVIVATLCTQGIIHYFIWLEKNDSTVINVAGRQRMLSQKIAKLSLQIRNAKNPSSLQRTLEMALDDWEEKHNGLKARDAELKLRGKNSAAIMALFTTIEAPFNTIRTNGRKIVATQDSSQVADLTVPILNNEAVFLSGMNEIVNQYERDAAFKINRLQITSIIIGVFIVIVIALELFYIIRPMFKRLLNREAELERRNQELLQQQELIRLQNETLKSAKEKAEAAAHTKSRFLSNMSHEIRTPMNVVMGMLYLLLEDNPREDQKDQLETMLFSAENLLVIINDILDFSKIEAGKLSLEARPFALTEVTQHIYKSLQSKAQNKGLLFQVDQPGKLPDLIVGDRTRLSQILLNLLNNAIKFTESGKVTLQIKVLAQTADDIKLHFAIQDTGIGIPAEEQSYIFESFSQVDDGATRTHGGTGLGLAITKRLLELQGSEIQLLSQPNQGSKFSFDLSFPIAHQSKSKLENSNKTLKNAALPNLGKVLVVEDNLFNIKVLEKMFALWKIEMDLATNGAEALERIKENEYSIVLMDLQMPVMDGYRTTEIIRSWPEVKYQQLPIIALSASAMEEFRDRAFSVGMNDYVTKPFIPRELFQTMERHASVE